MNISLARPYFEQQHIKERIICVRAHRERIFRVEPEQYGNKIVFHNYGHGGAGWTFLFGSVAQSIRQFEAQNTHSKKSPLSVIGAGCYGLLTAIELVRKGYHVNIIASQTKQLPSHNAAGFFFPRARRTSTESEKSIFLHLGMESYRTYRTIAGGLHPFIPDGPKLIPAYYGRTIDPGFNAYIKNGIVASPQEATIFFNTTRHEVMRYETIFINPGRIMQHLETTVQTYGIPIIKKTLTSFDEIREQIIFNCAGMGAKQLTHDKKIIPVQGHLITLKNQPHPEQLQYMINVKVPVIDGNGILREKLLYYAPKDNGILGITFLRGKRSHVPNYQEFDLLLERCAQFFEGEK